MIQFREREIPELIASIQADNLWVTQNCKDYEVIDLSNRKMKLDSMQSSFLDLHNDTIFRHADFSGNFSEFELSTPIKAMDFFISLKDLVFKNGRLTSLNISNNHLFGNFPHPTNEHTKNYVSVLTDTLLISNIKHLDLSNNNITGKQRQQTLGLSILTNKFLKRKARSFICQNSGLSSVSFSIIAGGLGVLSSLIHLDLSDNFGGLHPEGYPSIEGALAFSRQISQSLTLRVLLLARNGFNDESCIHIIQGTERIKTLEVLDLSGNEVGPLSGAALRELMVNHSLFGIDQILQQSLPKTSTTAEPLSPKKSQKLSRKGTEKLENDSSTQIRTGETEAKRQGGLQILKISHCPLQVEGVEAIAEGLMRSESLVQLEMNHCGITDSGMESLRAALELNHSITAIYLHGNLSSKTNVKIVQAEVIAQKIISELKANPLSLDSSQLTLAVQSAVIRKMKQLTQPQLYSLYNNPSFNHPALYQQYRESVAAKGIQGGASDSLGAGIGGAGAFLSPLRLALEELAPPTRNTLFQEVKKVRSVQDRLKQSEDRVRHVNALLRIKKPVMKCIKRFREAQLVAKALEEMRLRNEEIDLKNQEDDEWARFSTKNKLSVSNEN